MAFTIRGSKLFGRREDECPLALVSQDDDQLEWIRIYAILSDCYRRKINVSLFKLTDMLVWISKEVQEYNRISSASSSCKA